MSWLKDRFSSQSSSPDSKLDKLLNTVLLTFGSAKYPWTIRQAVTGVQIYGSTGSGKSSGSAESIARSFLENDFGGLVLCAKPEERVTWERLCKVNEREKDLLILEHNGKYGINILEYENRQTKGGDEIMNLVNLIMQLHEIERGFMAGGAGAGENERFWDNALRRLLSRTISLLKYAQEPVSFERLRNVIEDIPGNAKQAAEMYNVLKRAHVEQTSPEAKQEANDLLSRNYFARLFNRATYNTKSSRGVLLVRSFFFSEFPRISDRTKSIIKESFSGIVEPFLNDGILRNYFEQDRIDDFHALPELAYKDGRIIIVDFDIKNYGLAGVMAQAAYKYLFQLAMERRDLSGEDNPRPVFLFADEGHFFLTEYDQLFVTTARSALVSTVFITQSINNYMYKMGTRNPEIKAKAFLANLNTRIFHNSSDVETNKWAADTIGKNYIDQESRTFSGEGRSTSITPDYRYLIEPSEFSFLKSGGPDNEGIVEAIIQINTDRRLGKLGNFDLHEFKQFPK